MDPGADKDPDVVQLLNTEFSDEESPEPITHSLEEVGQDENKDEDEGRGGGRKRKQRTLSSSLPITETERKRLKREEQQPQQPPYQSIPNQSPSILAQRVPKEDERHVPMNEGDKEGDTSDYVLILQEGQNRPTFLSPKKVTVPVLRQLFHVNDFNLYRVINQGKVALFPENEVFDEVEAGWECLLETNIDSANPPPVSIVDLLQHSPPDFQYGDVGTSGTSIWAWSFPLFVDKWSNFSDVIWKGQQELVARFGSKKFEIDPVHWPRGKKVMCDEEEMRAFFNTSTGELIRDVFGSEVFTKGPGGGDSQPDFLLKIQNEHLPFEFKTSGTMTIRDFSKEYQRCRVRFKGESQVLKLAKQIHSYLRMHKVKVGVLTNYETTFFFRVHVDDERGEGLLVSERIEKKNLLLTLGSFLMFDEPLKWNPPDLKPEQEKGGGGKGGGGKSGGGQGGGGKSGGGSSSLLSPPPSSSPSPSTPPSSSPSLSTPPYSSPSPCVLSTPPSSSPSLSTPPFSPSPFFLTTSPSPTPPPSTPPSSLLTPPSSPLSPPIVSCMNDMPLGTGACGIVYQVTLNGSPVALKIANLSRNERAMHEFANEITLYEALAEVQGEIIPQLVWHGPLDGRGWYGIATTLCDPQHLATEEEKRVVLGRLAQLGVVHQDVREENFVRSPQGQLFVIDFGQSYIEEGEEGEEEREWGKLIHTN